MAERALSSHSKLRLRQFSFQFEVPFPNLINHGINNQLQQERSKDAADHGCRDALHHVRARASGPHDGNESEKSAGHGHHLRSHALDRAMVDRLAQVFAESGGDLVIAAPEGRAAELDALLDELVAEVGGMRR